ncbi:hypothetical protein H257_18327 [Aphanomyces astaci]|uniref:Uncharacterized protein n=1 Tax=Aphanomyces astaci TaxID=112090 RepID=W4FDD0_APHAT|nr:hypothetical protein H257_18327 [Aphanomyces astaci]ETV64846.1 hypothetical protein H257_18327 [Aphanomyces astaci]|eukprot:XP_009845665.1 hypothetical protein H257_18327 [Aphanomyces astaci]
MLIRTPTLTLSTGPELGEHLRERRPQGLVRPPTSNTPSGGCLKRCPCRPSAIRPSWTGPCGSRRHPESSLARLLPNGPHTMPAALQRVNEEVESLGDALKQAREERVAEMALREKVEQERDQANTERDNWKSVSGDSGQNSQALAEKERVSDDLGFTKQRLAATMSEKRRVWKLQTAVIQGEGEEVGTRRNARTTSSLGPGREGAAPLAS